MSAMANARDFKFCTRVGHSKFSFVMRECSLSGRGQGHVSNFYIVDLENFTTASRRYTGDIHNSPESDWDASRLSAHVYYASAHLNPPTS